MNVAGILGSDNDSDDSFFGTAKPAKKKSAQSEKSEADKMSRNIKKSSIFDDDDDFMADLGFNPKQPKEPKKSGFLDELLATSNQKSESKSISRQSTETTDHSVRPKTAGRPSSSGRPTSALSSDPLDLFAAKPKPKNEDPLPIGLPMAAPRPKTTASTADWLGLGDKSEKEAEVNILKIEKSRPSTPERPTELSQQIFPVPDPSDKAIQLVAGNMQAMNTISTTQQQMSQLMMAEQLKNQELSLLELNKRQQDLLHKQEAQFNDLVEKQLTRQRQLEVNIKSQQDRINAHIHLLMTQPSLPIGLAETYQEPAKIDEDLSEEDRITLGAEVKKLELEKLRLEDALSNASALQEKEIQIIESAYKKQISVLDANLESVVKRLEDEAGSIKMFYDHKINMLEEDNRKISSTYEDQIRKLTEDHKEALSEMKLSHREEIKFLNEEHKTMITTIKESKLLEFSIVQDNTSYVTTLRQASSVLENLGEDFQALKEDMISKATSIQNEREMKLMQRERLVEDAEKRFKLQEENIEEDRNRLMNLVASLETQLNSLSSKTAEENWMLRQKLSSLQAEKEAFEKEKLFTREQMGKDEARVEELKQMQIEQYKKHLLSIEDERRALSFEKAKLETERKLVDEGQLRNDGHEVEAAIEVAKQATREAEQQKHKYIKLQKDVEKKRKELCERESEIRMKEEEIEGEMGVAKALETRAREAIAKYRQNELSLIEKMNFIQNKIGHISEKENQLSQERMLLSKEKLELNEMRQKIESNKCSLCKLGEHIAVKDVGPNKLPDNITSVDSIFDGNIGDALRKLQIPGDFQGLFKNEFLDF